jgi:hypothetical protein
LVIIIKAKLEAVEAGVSTFEDEFAMQMTLPGGQRVRDYVLPAIEETYEHGVVPGLFSGSGLRELEA